MERRDNKNIILVAIFTIVFVLSTEFVLYLLLSGSGDSINFFSGNSGKSIAGGISKIYDATLSEKELKIYVKVAFQYDSTLFYDSQLTNIIEEISTCTSELWNE